MTRQGLILAFPKTVYHLQLFKTAGAILAETHHVFTDVNGLNVCSLVSLIQAAQGQGPCLSLSLLYYHS